MFTNDDALAEKMSMVRNHGCKVRHDHPMIGLNGRFDTLQAAILLAKFPHFEEEVAARHRLGQRYHQLLDGCATPATLEGNTMSMPNTPFGCGSGMHFRHGLSRKGRRWPFTTPSVSMSSRFTDPTFLPDRLFPFRKKLPRVISLPMHPFLTEEEQTKVASAVRAFVEREFAVRVCGSFEGSVFDDFKVRHWAPNQKKASQGPSERVYRKALVKSALPMIPLGKASLSMAMVLPRPEPDL